MLARENVEVSTGFQLVEFGALFIGDMGIPILRVSWMGCDVCWPYGECLPAIPKLGQRYPSPLTPTHGPRVILRTESYPMCAPPAVDILHKIFIDSPGKFCEWLTLLVCKINIRGGFVRIRKRVGLRLESQFLNQCGGKYGSTYSACRTWGRPRATPLLFRSGCHGGYIQVRTATPRSWVAVRCEKRNFGLELPKSAGKVLDLQDVCRTAPSSNPDPFVVCISMPKHEY